ncbi:MAG TPA: DinB family protein [Tepidisphaeraceae bacterium]|jgi:uncharacterized damage-inducible protein DinB|nr:DinB family protein [Tepidisphaeraceae bacterium]
MHDYFSAILSSQFEAALCMMHHCIKACSEKDWEGKIANATFRQVAYHTLFFVDLYLSASAESFELRDLHRLGGDERGPTVSRGLSKSQTLEYLSICRQKAKETLASETAETLQGPGGFRKFSRAELHIYSIRHIQHHTGQLSAYLRRLDPTLTDSKILPWVGSGWR